MSGTSTIGKSLQKAMMALEGRVFERSAPAKVNLRLKVLGRRPDGYHLLSMLNGSTSLSDLVRVSFHQGLSCSVRVQPVEALPPGSGENLVSKAWRAFWREIGIDNPGFGYDCSIEKRIPIGGGLGGGSSNAAVMFRLLVECFGAQICREVGLSEKELEAAVSAAALSCGADVPYAVHGGLAVVSGIGERVRRVTRPAQAGRSIVLMVPPVSVPTLTFYDYFRRSRPSVPESRDLALEEFIEAGRGELVSLVENDFENAVCELEPVIGEGLRAARSVFPRGTALTGSGAVFFSLVPPGGEEEVPKLADKLQGLGVTCHLCSLLP